jgi:tetratricopeptide (TPR) repeat protein
VRDGRYDIAIENFSQAINLDPQLDSAYFNRGLAYHSKGDSDRAVEDIKKSQALNPDNPEYGEKLRELGIL